MPEQFTPRVRRVADDERQRMQYVTALLREKRIDEAREALLSIIKDNDKSVSARLLLGFLYQRQRMLPDALEQFRQAMTIDPMEPRGHLLAGLCTMRMGDNEGARRLIQTAIDLDPKLVDAHVAMAQVLSETEASAEAIAHLEEAQRLDPQMVMPRVLMARVLNRQGKTDDAMEELEGLLSAKPSHVGASWRLALLHSQRGENDQAIKLLQTAIASMPQSAMLWMFLGRVKLNMKDYAGAEAAFNEFQRQRPRNMTGLLRLVETLIPQGKFDQARALLQRIPRRSRLATLVHQFYGDIHALQNNHDEAIECYRAALLHSEGGPEAVTELEGSWGPKTDRKAKLAGLQAALAKQRDEGRKRLADLDWQEMLERMMPQAGQFGAGRRDMAGPAPEPAFPRFARRTSAPDVT
jgi:tetratricopeptide (TPR) repeat protein